MTTTRQILSNRIRENCPALTMSHLNKLSSQQLNAVDDTDCSGVDDWARAGRASREEYVSVLILVNYWNIVENS